MLIKVTEFNQREFGFKRVGKNVLISDKAVFYGAENIEIGDNVRIDDFAILSAGKAGFLIGNYVHIACHATIIGQGKVFMDDYSGISSRVAVYSSSDNYDGLYMTNPTIPEWSEDKFTLRNTYHEAVYIGKHVVVGSGSTILPGVNLLAGCAVGAMSLVLKGNYNDQVILAGIPAKPIGTRLSNIFDLEKHLS